MKAKYSVRPGYVTSIHDGQRHYITARMLMDLYGVKPYECMIFEPAKWWQERHFRSAEAAHAGLIALRPRYDGDYMLPEVPQ